MIFGPRPFDVRARPAEARSEERPEPTFVGEDAPQDRNEGGRDAAASGRWEKINGLLDHTKGVLDTSLGTEGAGGVPVVKVVFDPRETRYEAIVDAFLADGDVPAGSAVLAADAEQEGKARASIGRSKLAVDVRRSTAFHVPTSVAEGGSTMASAKCAPAR